jgi:hypothetical protein
MKYFLTWAEVPEKKAGPLAVASHMMTDHVKTLAADPVYFEASDNSLAADPVDFEASDNSLAADPARMPVAMNQ